MIDTIYFDNWNTIAQAPELMRRGSSTRILHSYIVDQGFDVEYKAFTDVYMPIATAHYTECEKAGYIEPDYRQMIEQSYRELEVDDPIEHSTSAWSHYLRRWINETEFFPVVPKMLKVLGETYKLGVITNYMDGPTCRKVFDKLGYETYFDSLVVSHELGYMKPANILFDTAMKETDSEPGSCVMVGDTYSADVVGGNKVGMKTVLIDLYNAQQEYYEDCTVVIKSIDEFPDALEKLVADNFH
jgi:putative hydrolase of the HAD superfamily